jgi:succinate dehydrogenase/fumarate reductase cytochrome b subunit
MQDNLKKRSSLLHRITIVIFMPIIIFVWIIGWALTEIGTARKFTEFSKEALKINHRWNSQVKKAEAADEDRMKANEPEIVT